LAQIAFAADTKLLSAAAGCSLLPHPATEKPNAAMSASTAGRYELVTGVLVIVFDLR
jgi:hypothetical protein